MTASDALDKAKEVYRHEEIVLDASDLISQDIFLADNLTSKVSLPDKFVHHLKLLIDYLEFNEQKDYESSNFPKDHIFYSIAVLKSLL